MDPGMECEDYEIDFNINVGYFIIDIFYLRKAKILQDFCFYLFKWFTIIPETNKGIKLLALKSEVKILSLFTDRF